MAAAEKEAPTPAAERQDGFAPSVIATEPTCDAGQKIFLLGSQGELATYDPSTQVTEALPAPRCSTSAAPNSMAIDSVGDAWVGFVDGTLFRVSPGSGACTKTGFDGAARGFRHFGMGVVGSRDGGDEIFVYENGEHDARKLGRVDPSTQHLIELGPLDVTAKLGIELTGRGDGALFGFFIGPPTFLARIDPASLRVTDQVDLPFGEVGAWAFAHWGGRFFLFTAMPGQTSHVDEFIPGRGTKRFGSDLTFTVVGAGVSPCAPTALR